MRTAARFPALAEDAGHYESFYLKACRPGGGQALWIRHTVHKRPGAQPTASIWFTFFDTGASGPRATKATFGSAELTVPEGAYIRVDGATLSPGHAVGRIGTDALEAEWDLRFSDRHEPLRHLPYERLYRARIPRTKLLSPHPGAAFSGTVSIDGAELPLEGWPGMIGHNWGSEHAERWIWIHGAGFEGAEEGDYLDVGAGRVKVGPLRTPWIANGMVVIGGEEHRIGGPGRIRGTAVDERPTSCEFVFPGKGATVRGTVRAEPKDLVGWVYADPDGPEHNTLNCSVADLEARVERPGRRETPLRAPGGAAYEIGMRETDHGIPVQPYPDG